MTTPRIEEMVEEFEAVFYEALGTETDPNGTENMYLIRNEYGQVKNGIDFTDERKKIENWLRQALTQAHQAGIDEAVDVVKKMKIKNQNYIDGLAPREMGYENPRFIESKGIIQALDDTIKALQDNN